MLHDCPYARPDGDMPLHYEVDGRQRRTVLGALTWFAVFVVLTFAFAYGWRLFVGPYTEFYNERVTARGKAQVYLQTDACRDSVTRSRLEGFNDCERSERILLQSAEVGAFYDLMNWMAICHNDICTIGGINVTDSLWSVGRLLFYVACGLYVASMLGVVTFGYGRYTGYYQLPQTMPGHFYGGGGGAFHGVPPYYNVQQPSCSSNGAGGGSEPSGTSKVL